MHWSPVLLAVASLCLGRASAHGNHGDDAEKLFPKLLGGRRLMAELLAERNFDAGQHVPIAPERAPRKRRPVPEVENIVGPLNKRQRGGRDGQCGAGYGSCARGYCCSSEGWCGISDDYCAAPDCQIDYGSGCDGNQRPEGEDTSAIARPKMGSVLYGGLGVYNCVKKGDIAMTFDDGPYNFTGDLLDKFASYGAKATFFITGNNIGKGMINDYSTPWPGFIKRMIAEGHQVASHTWSHQNASQMTDEQMKRQVIWNEIAFNDILGFFPTYHRPPYSICEKKCQNILANLGYHIIYFDLDTEGYLHDQADEVQDSKDIWDQRIRRSNANTQQFLLIEHDIHWQVVYNLTDYILTGLFAKGYRAVTVGECLGDPPANWYRAGSGSLPGPPTAAPPPPKTTNPPPSSRPTSSRSRQFPTTTIRPTRIPDQPLRGARPNAPDEALAPPQPTPDRAINPGPTRAAAPTPEDVVVQAPARGGTPSTTIFATGRRRPGADEPAATAALRARGADADAVWPHRLPVAEARISEDGACTGADTTCAGSRFGNCCSASGFCGGTLAYCGEGCQEGRGRCGAAAVGQGAASPAKGVSVDGSCGGGASCLGSGFGNCCSEHGW